MTEGFGDPRAAITLEIHNLERVARIELANTPWQGVRLPLHHTRIKLFSEHTLAHKITVVSPAGSDPAFTDFQSVTFTRLV